MANEGGLILLFGIIIFIILLVVAPWLVGIFFLIIGIFLMFIPIIGWIPGLICILIGVILIAIGFGRKGKVEIKQQVQQIVGASGGKHTIKEKEMETESKVEKVIICPKCYSENDTNAIFCNKCGKRLKQKKSKKK